MLMTKVQTCNEVPIDGQLNQKPVISPVLEIESWEEVGQELGLNELNYTINTILGMLVQWGVGKGDRGRRGGNEGFNRL